MLWVRGSGLFEGRVDLSFSIPIPPFGAENRLLNAKGHRGQLEYNACTFFRENRQTKGVVETPNGLKPTDCACWVGGKKIRFSARQKPLTTLGNVDNFVFKAVKYAKLSVFPCI